MAAPRYSALEQQQVMWEKAMKLVSLGIDLQSHGDIIAAEESLQQAVLIMESALTDIQYHPSELEQAQKLNKKMKRYIKMIKSQQREPTSPPEQAARGTLKGRTHRVNIVNWANPPQAMIPVLRALESSPACGDILGTLCRLFGFQEQNALNQRENVALLVTNQKLQAQPPGYVQPEAASAAGDREEERGLQEAIGKVHSHLFDNYRKWCKYMGMKPNFSPDPLVDVVLFFLIWGEAANFRQTPEFLCFLFHKMSRSASTCLGRDFETLAPGSFLSGVIKPMYAELSRENNKKTAKGIRADHVRIMNYDDFNEFFWAKKCLKYEPNNVASAFTPSAKGASKMAKKTFKEKRGWTSACLAYGRIFLFNCALFLATVAFSLNMTAICPQANVLYTLHPPPIFRNYSFLDHPLQVLPSNLPSDHWNNLVKKKADLDQKGPDKAPRSCSVGALARCLGTTVAVLTNTKTTSTAKGSKSETSSATIVDFPSLNFVMDFGLSSSTEGCVSSSTGRCQCYLNKIEKCFSQKGSFRYSNGTLDTKRQMDQKTCKEITQVKTFYDSAKRVINDAGPGLLNCNKCNLALSSILDFGGGKKPVLDLIMELNPLQKSAMIVPQAKNGKEETSFTRLIVCAAGVALLAIFIILELQRCLCSGVGIGFIGRKLRVPTGAYWRYTCFWIFLYLFKLIVSYQVMVKPLVEASVFIVNYPHDRAQESYHFLIPTDIFQADYLAAIWIPVWLVFMYDVQIWYSIFSVIVGGVRGFNLRVGEVRSFRLLRQTFRTIPDLFNKKIVPNIEERNNDKRRKKLQRKQSQPGNADFAPLRRFERVSYSEGNDPLLAEAKKYSALLDRSLEKYNRNRMDRNHERPSIRSSSVSTSVTSSSSPVGLVGPAFDRSIAFAMAWNRALETLREADVISNRELNVLSYLIDSKDEESLEQRRLYMPAFLTAGKLDESIDIIEQCAATAARLNQDSKKRKKTKHVQKIEAAMRERLLKDGLRVEAVLGSYAFASQVLFLLLGEEHEQDLLPAFHFIEQSITNGTALQDLDLTNLHELRTCCSELMRAILEEVPDKPGSEESIKFQRGVYFVIGCVESVLHELKRVLSGREDLVKRLEETPFRPNSFFFPGDQGHQYAAKQLSAVVNDGAVRDVVSRAYYLLSVDNLDAEPRSEEGRRRLRFFTNSLFMDMPLARALKQMRSFGVCTPYYGEIVLYSLKNLLEENKEGMKLLFYLATIYPFEWANFLERIGASDTDSAVRKSPEEVRLWASYRGQTLARTVRGMMYYEDVIRFLHWLEIGEDELMHISGCTCNKCRRLDEMVDLKFSYVCTCQIYGKMKDEQRQQALDIDQLLHMHSRMLRVAYVDGPKKVKEGPPKYFSVLIKSSEGRIVEVYRVELPGNPILGEGKPENHNHAIIFTRGEMLQVIDMNQDGYFEEALKMPNLLATMDGPTSKKYPVYIIGLREHIFTGGVSNLASFMGIQELSFVSLGQRVLALFMIRMHYGHPDVFDKLFAATTGGTAKASKGVNLSEDIFAGFNATLRGGRITHEEFIQVGKGRDVGMQQLTLFEAKLASGAGEAVMSRDVRRLGKRLDFWRLNTFYFGNLGWYMTQCVTMLAIYCFIYGKLYTALSGKGDLFLRQGGLSIAGVLNTSWALQMGMLLVIPIIAVVGVESGFRQGFSYLFWNILTLGPIYFAFHIGTKSHYLDRTLLHGGAKYRATGRGFTIKHEKFAELYRFYASSHFYRGVELIFLLILFAYFGTFSWCNCPWTVDAKFYDNIEPPEEEWNARCYAAHYQSCVLPTNQNYGIITFSLWIIACTFVWGPFFFNPSGLDWDRCIEDLADWQNWLRVENETAESWLGWWMEENAFYENSPNWARILTLFRSARFLLLAYIMYLDLVYRQTLGVDKPELVKDINIWVYIELSGFFIVFGILLVLGYWFSRVLKKWKAKQKKLRKLKMYVFLIICLLAIGLLMLGLNVAALLEVIVISLLVLYYWQMWFIVNGHTSHITVRAIGVFFDRLIGWIIFGPILVVAMFLPFISDFQKRVMFNPAFTAGLEVGKLLANEESGRRIIRKDHGKGYKAGGASSSSKGKRKSVADKKK